MATRTGWFVGANQLLLPLDLSYKDVLKLQWNLLEMPQHMDPV